MIGLNSRTGKSAIVCATQISKDIKRVKLAKNGFAKQHRQIFTKLSPNRDNKSASAAITVIALKAFGY
jgi:hypothetical protein